MQQSIKNILFLVTFAFVFYTLNAQESKLYFDQINYDEDFSSSMISSLVQSDKGFIWIGTENGLFKYDGYSFNRYVRDKNEGSLSNSHVNVIFEDSQRNLWIGTNHGVNLFNKNANNFTKIDVSGTKGGRNYISSIVEDHDHTVWVGTFGGVKKINKISKLLEPIKSDANFILNKSRVLSLFYDEEYGLIIGTATGIQSFDPITSEVKKFPKVIAENKEFLKAKVWKTLKEPNGDLWFGTETMGVFLYSKAENTLTQFKHDYNDANSLSSNWINDIIAVDANTLWIASQDGLNVYNKTKKTFERYKHNSLNNFSLSDNNLQCFLKDKHGCIWLGTKAGEINFYNKANSNFTNISETIAPNFGLNNAIASALVKENDHALWVGTHGGGLTYLNLKKNTASYFMVDAIDEKKTKNLITALAQKDKNNLICGTFNGLFSFDKNTKKFNQISLAANGLIEDERPITALLVDHENIWVGTDGNGLKCVLKNGTVENYLADKSSSSLSDNFIMDLENRKDGIWISTQNGLNYFDKALKKVTKTYRTTSEPAILNNSLTVLFTDSKKRLWIGGDYDGLFYFDEVAKKFFVLNKENGLTNATIKSINEDAQGNIWVGSEGFLFKVKIKNDSRTAQNSDFGITKFSEKDGVSIKQFSYNASLLLNEKQLVFGATKGITLFDPSTIYKVPNDGQIVFTTLIINNEVIASNQKNGILNKPISETSEITINYDQGYLGLEFSSLNFVNPKKSRYAYKLDDDLRNDDWHNTGTQNRINLSNLNPGNYILSIKSTNEDSGWNPKIKTLKIKVLPPWWKTWWAYLIYLFLFILSTYIISKFIKNRVKLKRELFLEHVESERKQEILNMQLNFFTNISHEIRTPLTLIKGPVEELLEAPNDTKTEGKLKTIQQNSDRLLKLVNELLDFRKSEKGHMRIYCEKKDIVAFCFEIFESFKGLAVKKNIEYKFVLNSNSIHVYFDKNQMEKVIFNLLSNAFKFTKKNGKIVFAVELESDHSKKVLIKIKDNGIGIPEASKVNIFNRFFQVDDRGVHNMGSGVGLALSKSIVELHKGEITMPEEKESWANTVFQIALLKGKKHLTADQINEEETNDQDNLIDADAIPSKIIIDDDCEIEFSANEYDPDKKTILIVEDNDEVRNFIINIINVDFNILDFSNAKEAILYMEKEIPDLIISDVMMPEMNGFQFCKHLKTNESTNHIPVILLTAKASTDNKIEGLSIGADAYISKPFSTKVLILSVQNLLKTKEIFRQKYSGNFIVDSDLDTLTTPEELFLKKLMKIIEENLENSDFDVNMLIDKIGMSRTILYKKVNTLTNHSVASLIKHMRLKKAADIILKTTYPISEVAFMVGFNDRKHFSREFKKIYNFSPTSYKNSKASTD
ncbi:integral membrane sensor hybrid histidine kinase [Cellulophaga algicola DSM 14237]|uniref:histidine kinase n=1 Tax=Cellulophaga algicola (strain DSM 14237 / IC166 / ACAM 630) TaxID=688270 RepID=E6X938_CELAD|nr:hybrid sensor histidine kinase/response regulator transcription factor [Cellulophaga algicola]ADV50848.1 integral membrane sensor hybrid histidine kinase [Cellulophaga algicola DSM 14237]